METDTHTHQASRTQTHTTSAVQHLPAHHCPQFQQPAPEGTPNLASGLTKAPASLGSPSSHLEMDSRSLSSTPSLAQWVGSGSGLR